MDGLQISNLKTLREFMCKTQHKVYAEPGGPESYEAKMISELIREIDRLRPLGSDGKHGKLHTYYCQCDLTADERTDLYWSSITWEDVQ